MKITHIIIGLNAGGAELMLARLVEAHRRLVPGVEHRVICLTEIGEIGLRLREQGISVRALGLGSALGVPLVLWRLIRILRQERPDIVQTWMYHADLLGGLAARFAGIRAVLWGIRTTDITKGGSRVTRGIRWTCARLSRRIPAKIVCAAEAALAIHAAIGYDPGRMVVIPNGLEIDHMKADTVAVVALRAERGIPAGACVIGTVGRFNPIKGQEDFVAAAGLIAAARPDCWFAMVGLGCDVDNAELSGWIAQTGAADRFVLLGKRQDVPTCLAAMDVFVLPSRTEGFPNVLAEAMAMGRSCVTTDVGDAARLLAGCGQVVPAQNPEALAAAVISLLRTDPEVLAGQGRAARHRIETEYSMARCAQTFEALYQSVSAPRKEAA